MTYIRETDYTDQRVRPKPLSNYLEKMTTYLRIKHPTVPVDKIEQFVKETIKERYKSPTVEAVIHRREGYSDHISIPLDQYITKVIKDNNISPSGSCYTRVSKKESFLRKSIEEKVRQRNEFKKIYLKYEAQGLKRESDYYNCNQANSKIFNNAIAGGMRIKQFILGSLAGFNAITSVGRMSVKQGYSFIERAVNGNIYLPSIASAISYILNHALTTPEAYRSLFDSNILYVPSVEDVSSYLLESISNYVSNPNSTKLKEVLEGLTAVERSYVFYVGCLSNLFKFNDMIMRRWIDSCFIEGDIEEYLLKDIDTSEIKSFKKDVIACILSTNYKLLGLDPEKKDAWNSIDSAATNNPEGLKKFIFCCKNFVTQFESMLHVLRPILRINTTFTRLTQQHRMARKTVPLSDTDSNIFSTQELIRWKREKIDFSQKAYEMNALVTFILSQSLEHVFARLSTGFGAEKEDAFKISMKNEFLYPILIATSRGKHYLAIATMQEGSLLRNPRKDIKGVGFRSSSYPLLIREDFDAFTIKLFAEIEKGEKIRASSILGHVAKLEHQIYTSLANQESTFLQTISIKMEEEYKDPSVSQYFYYELWKAVFEEDYGEMEIPNKCFKIPLKQGKRFFKNEEYMNSLKLNYPKIHTRLLAFVENNKNRDISAFLIPPFRGKVNPFFLEVMDVREQISKVMAPYYNMLNGLGIGTVDNRVGGLVSDFYDPSTPVIK